MMGGMKEIKHDGELLAIVIDLNDFTETLNFISKPEFPLQVGIHNRETETVEPHRHKDIKISGSIPVHEFFYVVEGKVLVDLYGRDGKKSAEQVLGKGHGILIIGGHAVKYLEKTKMIEVKPGPYKGKEEEKIFFR